MNRISLNTIEVLEDFDSKSTAMDLFHDAPSEVFEYAEENFFVTHIEYGLDYADDKRIGGSFKTADFNGEFFALGIEPALALAKSVGGRPAMLGMLGLFATCSPQEEDFHGLDVEVWTGIAFNGSEDENLALMSVLAQYNIMMGQPSIIIIPLDRREDIRYLMAIFNSFSKYTPQEFETTNEGGGGNSSLIFIHTESPLQFDETVPERGEWKKTENILKKYEIMAP